jgi:hypothetical protein
MQQQLRVVVEEGSRRLSMSLSFTGPYGIGTAILVQQKEYLPA